MSVWDKTTPAGSDPIAEGDDRIRELKDALEAALSHEGVFPGASPSTTPIFIPTFLRAVTGSRPTGDDLVTGRIFFNTTTNVIERYNGATWDTIFTLPADGSIDANKLAASVAGSGLAGGGGSALSVNVDGTTIEVNSDTLRIAASAAGNGLTGGGGSALAVNVDGTTIEISGDAVRIAASAAGSGLGGGGGSALSVNVDNSTIEINSDSLRVKDGGITEAKLDSGVVAKLGQNIGFVAFATTSGVATIVNYTGQGRLKGVAATTGLNLVHVKITIDGTLVCDMDLSASAIRGIGYDNAGFAEITNGACDLLDLHFKTSLKVETTSNAAGRTVTVAYERQA